MNKDLKFPRFDCLITGREEEYDAEIARYFIAQDLLASEIAELRESDSSWSENYNKILEYLKSLEQVLIHGGEAPSHKFMIDLAMADITEDDSYERLSRSQGELTAKVYRAVVSTRDLMFWFRKISRDEEFSSRFTLEIFQALPFLRLVLTYRSVELSRM